ALDNARLYKDQARLNDELVLARDDALSSSKAKSQFLANMSHEIRTPLNGIIGMASLLNTLDIGEEAQSMVGTISSSGRTLLRVLDEVLDLARIEAGRMEIELVPTNVDRVVTEVASLYRSEALKNGVEITFDAPKTSMPLVLLDSLRFRQVVSNLVSNAVKFTHGGTVGLSWTWIHVGESLRLSFRVRDTGIGIPSDRLTKVFESFTQADGSIQRKYGGSGLGLAITQHLVELMGGLISVQSEVGIGTVFEITLTLEPTIETPRKPDPLQEPQPAGLYVLLAEDNSVNVLVVKAILGKLGCTVDVAEDGLRAIEMAEKDRYDLLLMDVQMPFCDGLEATRILRKAEALHHKSRLPIVALTANAMASDREACAKAGMDDFISKPITLDAMGDLLARVKSRNMTIAMQI
ncbi:response regulator, partial [bacterium]